MTQMKRVSKFRVVFGLLGVLGACFVADKASAGAWVLQASSGHIWNGAGLGGLTSSDGTVSSPVAGSSNYIWVIPVPVSTTAATSYTPTQYTGNSGGGTVCSRLASFASDGSFFQGAACSTGPGMGGAITVPANGTLFSQSTLNSNGFGSAKLNQVKVMF